MEIKIDKPKFELGDRVKILPHALSPNGAKEIFGVVQEMVCNPTITIKEEPNTAQELTYMKNVQWIIRVKTAGKVMSENELFVELVQSKWHMYEAPITVLETWVLNTLYVEDTALEFYEYHKELEHLQELGYVSGVRFDGPRVWSLTTRGRYYINRG